MEVGIKPLTFLEIFIMIMKPIIEYYHFSRSVFIVDILSLVGIRCSSTQNAKSTLKQSKVIRICSFQYGKLKPLICGILNKCTKNEVGVIVEIKKHAH